MIHFHVLGKTDLRTSDGTTAHDLLAQPRPIALLAYLAVARPGAFYRRDHLAALFWPETDQDRARTNLRKLVYTLRRALGDDVIASRGDEELGLAPETLWCDAVEFAEAFQKGWLARALELYEGDFLPAFFIPGAASFDEWLDTTRAHLADTASAAAWAMAQRFEGERQLTNAARWARRAFELAPEDERRLRHVIELLDRVGDRASALRLYEKFRDHLATEYDAIPAPETRTLVDQIRSR